MPAVKILPTAVKKADVSTEQKAPDEVCFCQISVEVFFELCIDCCCMMAVKLLSCSIL